MNLLRTHSLNRFPGELLLQLAVIAFVLQACALAFAQPASQDQDTQRSKGHVTLTMVDADAEARVVDTGTSGPEAAHALLGCSSGSLTPKVFSAPMCGGAKPISSLVCPRTNLASGPSRGLSIALPRLRLRPGLRGPPTVVA